MNWQGFLSSQVLNDVVDTDHSYIYPLTELAMLAIRGVDAAPFLQGQVTCNVNEVTLERARFGAMCTPKGRVITTFVLIKQDDGFLMLLPTVLAHLVKERLAKYVLRAKVRLTLTDWCVLGVSSDNTDFLSTEVNRLHLGKRDVLWCASEDLQCVWQDFLTRGFNATVEQQWQYLDIVAGLPWLNLATTEQFIPQMLNMDALGGISYNKGCYTGQEIVARTHYLGKAKRALFLAESELTPAFGTEVLNAQGQSVGLVLNAALDKLLIVLQEGATSDLSLKGYNVSINLLMVETDE